MDVIKEIPNISVLTSLRPSETNIQTWRSTERDCNKSWIGDHLPDYLRYFEKSWPDGIRKLDSFANKVKSHFKPHQTKKRKFMRGSRGDELDIHSVYRSNLPRAWTLVQKQKHPRTRVSIWIDVCQICDTRPDAMFWNGATALIWAERLIKRGHSVQIVAVANVKRNWSGERNQISVTLKDFHQNLNRHTLAIACHAGFFRYHVLKAWCSKPERFGYGYGPVKKAEIPQSTDKVHYYLFGGIYNEEKAVEVIKTLEVPDESNVNFTTRPRLGTQALNELLSQMHSQTDVDLDIFSQGHAGGEDHPDCVGLFNSGIFL